ncbi:pleckstrin homology domain-containing family O member 2 [Gastrophryne carolinensis]
MKHPKTCPIYNQLELFRNWCYFTPIEFTLEGKEKLVKHEIYDPTWCEEMEQHRSRPNPLSAPSYGTSTPHIQKRVRAQLEESSDAAMLLRHARELREQGVKGSSVSPTESPVVLKAGWLKKSSGLLGLWKDRYIQILRTQLLICEDDQKCLETLELANYERCQDHKAFLKRKRQFTLIPCSGTKVQEVKFQAKNAEERDEWIQNLNDGINRGKNKILDDVTVDTSSLEHVTRSRVKVGAAKRRPPTRIHLKEVAEAADDDSLRLGLEALDTEALTVVPPMPKAKEAEPQPGKEPVKKPMPPTKPNQLQTAEATIPDTTDNREDQAPSVPLPPPKSLKESVYAREKLLSENELSDMEEEFDFQPISVSKENLSDMLSSPPKPPPKILSDKMKIKWVGSTSDLDEKDYTISEERGSKENLVEFESDEVENPSSEEIQTSEVNNSKNNIEGESHRLSKHLAIKVNVDNNLQKITTESNSTENIEKYEHEENYKLVKDAKNETIEQPVVQKNDERKVPCLKYRKKTGHMKAPKLLIEHKTKASSMGDLLSPTSSDYSNDNDLNMSHLTKDHLQQVEMKLARGKERTKALLDQVLMGQLGSPIEGNGMEGNPETILNELMTQLQEASEVLKVIKETGQKSIPNLSEVVTERKNETQRELQAIQRRSVPF